MTWRTPDDIDPQIIRMLHKWIDDLRYAEKPPEGMDPNAVSPDRMPDLFSVISALLALSREIHLQSKKFQGLSDDIGPLGTHLGSIVDQTQTVLSQAKSEAVRAKEEGKLELVEHILDIQERLERQLDFISEYRPRKRWWQFKAENQEAFRSIEGSFAVIVKRIEDVLNSLGFREIHCIGRPVDPGVMRVAEIKTNAAEGVVPNTVLEVIRKGYTYQGKIIRYAEVKAAARKSIEPTPVTEPEEEEPVEETAAEQAEPEPEEKQGREIGMENAEPTLEGKMVIETPPALEPAGITEPKRETENTEPGRLPD